MNGRRTRLPELILARLAAGVAPVDGVYWFERAGRSWIDRSKDRSRLRADAGLNRRPRYTDTD